MGRSPLLALCGLLAGCAAPFDLAVERERAAWRPRRVIMNNDGNDCLDKNADEPSPRSAEELLRRRSTALLGTHVDSIFYCDGVFNLYTHQSEESELRREAPPPRVVWAEELYAKTGKDPLSVMIGFCRQHQLEIFWSMRMNDTHDSSDRHKDLLCRWKRDNPELMLGTRSKRPRYGGRRWSAVDYGKAAVRNKVLRIITDVVTRYDVDGVELDFFRHPVYFRAAAQGKPVPQAEMDKLTALLRQIRGVVDTTARQRRKPILISVRVPDSVGFCRAMGLDLRAWLEADLLDLMVGGGYLHLRPWADWAALGREYGIPVYAGLSASRLVSPSSPEGKADFRAWRGEALAAWEAGVQGIYTFNRFDPHSPLFRELGDPELLRNRPHSYTFNPGNKGHLERWVRGGPEYVVPPTRR